MSLKQRILAAAVLSTLAPATQAAFTLTTIPAAQWGAADSVLGVAGYVIENFEDTALIPGLQIGWNATAGVIAPASTLPRTFDPRPTALGGDDGFGNAFYSHPCGTGACTSVWDGSRVLLSALGNQSYLYTASNNWGDLDLAFTTPAQSVGFSLQQNEFIVTARINGSAAALNINAASGGGRLGYVRIDATGGDVINSIRLDNGGGDGFAIDHLAVAAVPEPETYGLMLAGLGVITWAVRRRRA
jgi:hypothetical protein